VLLSVAALLVALVAGSAIGLAFARGGDEEPEAANALSSERPTTTTAAPTTTTPTTSAPPTSAPPTSPPPPTTTVPPTPTTAPDPCATPPAKNGPDHAANCLYSTYVAGDQGAAGYFASPEVVAKLFEYPFEPPEWTFLGCDPAEPNYDVCWFDAGPIPGIAHGLSAEMTVFTTPSAGSTVEQLEFYG
jgi:hypothetical protein